MLNRNGLSEQTGAETEQPGLKLPGENEASRENTSVAQKENQREQSVGKLDRTEKVPMGKHHWCCPLTGVALYIDKHVIGTRPQSSDYSFKG